MSNAGIFYLTTAHIQFFEGCSVKTAYKRIAEVMDINNIKRNIPRITLKEYAEHFQLPVPDLCSSLNKEFKTQVEP